MGKIFKQIFSIEDEKFHIKVIILGIKFSFRKCHTISCPPPSGLGELVEEDRKNYNNIIERIRKNNKCRVAFYIFEIAKWKTDSLFQLMLQDNRFEPFIVIGITTYRVPMYSQEEKMKTFLKYKEYFEQKGYKVEIGYDIQSDKHIPLKAFNPDIVFYQQHVVNCRQNSVETVMKYALTCYVPYNVPNYLNIEYDYNNFCSRLFRFYTLNEELKYCYQTLGSAIENICASGHTALDYWYLNKNNQNESKYVIYAPHFSIMHPAVQNKFYYSTFNYNGDFILEFAKQHPEISWVFKPHPNLKESLRKMQVTNANIENYYSEWEKIGIVCENSDYNDLFANSKAMITDCGSFLTEYFCTGKPLIHLIHPISINWPPKEMLPMFDSFYKVHNNEELLKALERIVLQGNDYKKEDRKQALDKMDFANKYAAKNIIDELLVSLKIEDLEK